jgi:hemerythrin superfamily protein
MDAITYLKDDHHTVEQLFKRFEQAGERAHVEERAIVDRIIEDLSMHAAIEEQVFYPVARAAVPETETIALESLEAHHIVKWLLSQLVDMDPAHERFDAKVTVLIENVRHHVEEEDSDFFPKVRKQLGRNELADLGETLANAKKSAPTRPHPRMPDAGPASKVAGAITGVADRVGDNVGGIAQGTVSAVRDLIARLTRSAASTATEGVQETARTAKTGATSTAKAAEAGAKGTATAAKKSARATATTAKRTAPRTAAAASSAS